MIRNPKVREDRAKELENKLSREIKSTMEYRSAVNGYINQNSVPVIGDIIVSENGKKVTIKYGGLEEVDEGKKVIQLKNDSIYIYEDKKAYDYETGEKLTNLIITVQKRSCYGGMGEKFLIEAMQKGKQWSYQANDHYYWKDISDISELPIEDLLAKYSISNDLRQFLNENFVPIPKKEQVKNEPQENTYIKNDDELTVDDLKKQYEYVFDKDDGIVTARKEQSNGKNIKKTREINGEISDSLFFKDKNGIVNFIPELSETKEGNIDGRHYKSSNVSSYISTRNGSHTFDVHEWGFDVDESVNLKKINKYEEPYRYDKYYRYVTLDDSQKVVKVFESKNSIDIAFANLYHRNKDENGKQCIRLVDLAGNVHSIKEGGKVGEKGLKEKTFGPRGDYQLKVVYKDKQPVYALFMGDEYTKQQREFCTAQELREFYEKQKRQFQRYGMNINEDSCFTQMEEIIENFNETFMQGNYVPSYDKVNDQKEDNTISELAKELSELNEKEKQAKQLLEEYQSKLPNKDTKIRED